MIASLKKRKDGCYYESRKLYAIPCKSTKVVASLKNTRVVVKHKRFIALMEAENWLLPWKSTRTVEKGKGKVVAFIDRNIKILFRFY
jgi:hypothetical protein